MLQSIGFVLRKEKIMCVTAAALAIQKIQELQKMTGKTFNECSSALHLANGDVKEALRIMKTVPDYNKGFK